MGAKMAAGEIALRVVERDEARGPLLCASRSQIAERHRTHDECEVCRERDLPVPRNSRSRTSWTRSA